MSHQCFSTPLKDKENSEYLDNTFACSGRSWAICTSNNLITNLNPVVHMIMDENEGNHVAEDHF